MAIKEHTLPKVKQAIPTSILFKRAANEQAYLKMGILGFPGSGKTYSSYLVARGLVDHLATKQNKPPILFCDTETGSDFLVKPCNEAGITLMVSKTRAFKDLLVAVDEAERLGGILIIDSITHFWMELQDAFKKEKKRSRLYFQDWGPIKETWREFTDKYLNSRVHIIMNGRAGYEYEYGIDEDGKKQLEKVGTKMKAETDMGYEPSLLVEMVREPQGQETVAGSTNGKRRIEGQLWDHVAYILKDRTRTIEGMRFVNPSFDSFQPAITYLNLGGEHAAVDTTQDSRVLFSSDVEKSLVARITRVKVLLEEIQGAIMAAIPGQSAAEKTAKTNVVFDAFGTRSWTAVENMSLELLQAGYEKVLASLERYVEQRTCL